MNELSSSTRARLDEHVRLLVVDDDVQTARLLVRVLEDQGYECGMVHDVASARERLRRLPAEVVLVDIRLPGESGLDLALELLDGDADVAVVMVTAVDDPAVASTAIEHGAYGYVIKPFEYNEVVIAVANALRRRRLVQANRSMVAELELLNNTKDTLMASLSHDLRSRLAVILTAADMLSTHRSNLTLAEHEHVTRCIVEGAGQAVRLVEGILERDRRGHANDGSDVVDVAAVVRTLVHDLGIEREVSVSDGPVPAAVDVVTVQRIVENLVVNAVKHTPPRTPIRIAVELEPVRGAVVIEVQDRGPGVPDDLKPRVFRPYVRGGTGADGWGVGLALVERFARLHGGMAAVVDREGGGATFRVVLPQRRSHGGRGGPGAEQGAAGSVEP